MNDTTQRRSQLSAAKQALLAKRMRGQAKATSVVEGIERRVEGEPAPLSFAQEQLWFLDQFTANDALYNISLAVRYKGKLDVGALERSLGGIIQRHEALRTTFVIIDGQPRQMISPTWSISLPLVNLEMLAEAEREKEAQRWMVEEAQKPFDLARGPLVRTTLLRLGEMQHILFLTMHHIISDGWSLRIFFRELAVFYEAYRSSRPLSLAALPIQYADYSVWQRQHLQGEHLQAQLAYWQHHLTDAPPLLELPADHPRPSKQSFRGSKHNFFVPASLLEALQALSRQEEVSLFMTLQAAFLTLLYRYTGREDLLVGTPVNGRTRPEIEGLIGFFVNTLVLRSDLSGNPTFRQLLKRVRQVTLDGYAHQHVPFERLVEMIQPDRKMSYSPLIQVMFAPQIDPQEYLQLPGLISQLEEVHSGAAKFDLTLELTARQGEGIIGSIEYAIDLFDAATITRMAGHWLELLEGIVTSPDQPISHLLLLPEAERYQLLVDWNDTRTDYPQDRCVHHCFEAQVERTPEAIAAIFEDKYLTYQELNQRANQLAHYLQTLGVGPEMRVGICAERSLEMLVGLLGILKAGGAYVPLDPAYPKERLTFMLHDSGVSVLLIQERLRASFPDHQATVLSLDADWQTIARMDEENPSSTGAAGNLAYVMYTSGSTGEPKGVAVPHRAINRLVCNTNYIDLRATDKVAQVSNASFDAATFEIWGALLHGAQLIGITKEVALSPRDFAAQLRDSEITVLFLTTALFNQLACEVPWAFASLRYLLFGGEAVEPKWVKEVLQKGAPEHLLHVYGPTENTTFTTWHLVKHVPEGATTIPIGRPIANTQVYILDKQQQPVPIGVPGELYIGGEGLARGYLNRPGLTNEYFVPHPFSDQPGARLYRSGDLGRYLPDGSIEFIGRADHQVKIRGFRIELGEVEAALSRHPAVREVVVMDREETPGRKYLAAYLVVDQQATPSVGQLRSHLQQQLPDYMVPSAFVFLDTLPLTLNGKVDRRVLPAPDRSRLEIEEPLVAPRTPIEQVLTEIWARVLNVEQVGIYDNFFELGGHSLLATQVVSRTRDAFDVNVPLSTLFQFPTVADMAVSILRIQAEQAGSEVLAQVLAEVEQLPEDEIRTMLFAEGEEE
jgi:amino acid adenylation domain-containing protein